MRIVGNNVTERALETCKTCLLYNTCAFSACLKMRRLASEKHTLIDGLWVYRGLLWSEIEVL